MKDAITAYPLSWPPGKPRTPEKDRRYGQFGRQVETKGALSSWKSKRKVTVNEAIRRIRAQVTAYTRRGRTWRIDPDDVIVSTNLRTRLDGLPYSNSKEPDDPGVAVYMELDDRPICIAVDTYKSVADNLAAVAAVLEALRALERHGSGLMEAAFTGFTALPAPGQVQALDWRRVLEYDGTDLAEAKTRFRQLAARHHPDRGGDAATFDTVARAWQQAQAELGGC